MEGDDPVPLRLAIAVEIAPHRLQAALDRFGAGIGKEHRIGKGRRHQPFSRARLPRNLEEIRHVPEPLCLLGQGLDQMRVVVAKRRHGDAAGEIEESSPVRREQICPFTTLESQIGPRIGRQNGREHDPSSFLISNITPARQGQE